MAFYSLDGNNITIEQFISIYEQNYFIGSNSRIPRNKTSKFVENMAEEILKKGINKEDIIFIIAWKVGCLNSKAINIDELGLKPIEDTLAFKTQYNTIDAGEMINFIYDNFEYLKSLSNKPFELYKTLYDNRAKYFGTTYLLTLVYFFTKGWKGNPFLDKFIPNKNILSKYCLSC